MIQDHMSPSELSFEMKHMLLEQMKDLSSGTYRSSVMNHL